METLVFGKENPPKIPLGKLVNTFRVGTKWSDKLKRGAVVELANYGGDAFGKAVVTDIICDGYQNLREYTKNNQTWAGHSLAYELLLQELTKVYPDFDLNFNLVTVIEYVRFE